MVQALGIAAELLTPAEIGAYYPELNLEDIALGSWAPDDGPFDPHMIMWGYMKRARAAGVTLREGVRATDLVIEQGRVIAVETSAGRIATECVIDAAGPWAAEVAGWAGVSLPLCNSARTIVVTNPVAEIPPDYPFVEELETEWYFRPEVDGVLMGMGLRPVDNPDVSLDEAQMEMIIDRAVHRVPALERASILTAWTGVRPLTPDDRPIIGPTPVGGLWLNSGWGGVGIIMAPLAGKLAAEYVGQGKTTTIDDSELRLDRFGSSGGG
jgi:sarcosine oxidase subunit beta